MREFISIVESFSNPRSYTWIRNDENKHVAEFSTEKNKYVITFSRYKWYNAWSVRFAIEKQFLFFKYNHLKSSNTGSQFQVLSTVIACVKDFLETIAPDRFIFSAPENKKGRLYDTIVNYMQPELEAMGYHRTDNDTTSFLFLRRKE